MLDDILDYVENIRQRPVWQPIPHEVRSRFHGDVPEAPSDLAAVHGEFMRDILPYTTGNVHPGFMGWVHGGGTPVGMLAEMLAAGLNANLGGRDHVPIEVERQIVRWMRRIFRCPDCPRCQAGFRGALRGCRREFETARRLHLGGGT
jgi:glutamate/tyrosine decarboxylase-like PLP-dependent enzyme